MTGTIFNIQRFSVNDGPGIRTTVFLKGCPLACTWCHNPESQAPEPDLLFWENRCIRCGACVLNCPHGAITMNGRAETDLEKCRRCGTCLDYCYADARDIVGRQITVDELMHEIEKDRSFYQESGGGVTLSGGEPLAQAEFAEQILKECKQRDIHTALDTCGYAEWRVIDRLRQHVDLFLFDLKIMNDRQHIEYTGVSNQLILENLKKLAHSGHNIFVRVPIIPGITDDRENIQNISLFVRDLPGIQVDILPYHGIAADKYGRLERDFPLKNSQTLTTEKLISIKSFMEQFEIPVNIGG